jgi:CzcA family heavy metal efflux pump
MLQAIVYWSIRHRVVVVCLALLLLGVGLYAAAHAQLDVFPEFTPPQVVIQTEAPGLSPAEVEQLVTTPIEQAVNGLPRLDVLRSKSIQGLSVITVIFQDGTDIYRARQLVTERLAELAGQLPAGVKPPRLEPLTTATGRLLTVGFTSDTLTPMQLRDVVQWQVRPRLLGTRGVAQVTLYGGEVRQLQVRVSPDALAARGLTLTDAVEAARQSTGLRGTGFSENDSQRVQMRAEAQVRTAAELGDTPVVTSEGTPVKLRDVARVVEGAQPKFGDASISTEEPDKVRPGVVMIVYKQFDADTMETTRRAEGELERLRPMLEGLGITYHARLFRQASFIEHALGNVTLSLLLGAALVAAVLFLFLFNLRTAFISLTAIPLSLLSAVVVLWAFGVSLNTLTLGGLAIAVGEVVDDAIIDVENIYRRLRENARLGHPRPAAAVVLSASLEVRTAVVYATFIVVLVFVPVFFMSGLQGRLFAPLGYAYVLAVLASLGVALTLTPALSLMLLARPLLARRAPPQEPDAPARDTGEPFLLRWLQAGYDRLLRRLDREVVLLFGVALVLFGAAVFALVTAGGEFLPELRENHFVVHVRGLPGTSLPQTMAAGGRLTRVMRDIPEVRSVVQQAGRAELGEDTWGVEYSEFEVDLQRLGAEDAEKVERTLKNTLKENVAGTSQPEVLSFLSERIQETLSGTTAPVAVKVYGDDLAAIDRAADDIARALAGVPGSANVHPDPQTGVPELVIRVRPHDAARFGLRNAAVLDAVHAAYQGAEVAQVYDRNRVIDVVVILDPQTRARPDLVAGLWLDAGAKGRLQLRQVADVYLSDGRFLVAHEGGLRQQVVTSNFNPAKAEKHWREKGGPHIRSLTEFATEAEQRVRAVPLPPGVFYVFTGEHEARRTAQRELLLLSLASFAGIVLLLGMVFRSGRRLLLVMVNVLFALVGGVAAVYLRGGVLDVGSLVGFVTLFGITMRNGMMMVSHWQHLHEEEGMPWGPELVFRGARERLAPVLMTALVTALGLLPIAVGSGEAGREIEGPMALVILGGLVTSTAMNLFLLPALYRRLGRP